MVIARSNEWTEGMSGSRAVRWSWGMLALVPVSLVAFIFWQIRADTSPTLTDTERIRGWESVLRELPATVPAMLVILLGFSFAVIGGRSGDPAGAIRAVGAHGVALFFMLLVIMNGSAENIMTTRATNAKWYLLPAELLITVSAVFVSRRLVVNPRRR